MSGEQASILDAVKRGNQADFRIVRKGLAGFNLWPSGVCGTCSQDELSSVEKIDLSTFSSRNVSQFQVL